jgi:hypothetical protein
MVLFLISFNALATGDWYFNCAVETDGTNKLYAYTDSKKTLALYTNLQDPNGSMVYATRNTVSQQVEQDGIKILVVASTDEEIALAITDQKDANGLFVSALVLEEEGFAAGCFFGEAIEQDLLIQL